VVVGIGWDFLSPLFQLVSYLIIKGSARTHFHLVKKSCALTVDGMGQHSMMLAMTGRFSSSRVITTLQDAAEIE